MLVGIGLVFAVLLAINPWLGFGGLLVAVLAMVAIRRSWIDKDLKANAQEVLRREMAKAQPSEGTGAAKPSTPGANPHKGPGVALVRSLRSAGFDVTTDGSSWLGGLPMLGGMTWPAGKDRRPMTPLAQIDLAAVTEKVSIPGLPATGGLAFFADLQAWPFSAAVRHVTGGTVTQPVSVLPPLENHTYGGPLRKGAAEAPTLIPA